MRNFIYLLLLCQSSVAQMVTSAQNHDSLISMYGKVISSINDKTQILGLGEQYHGDGKTFSIKSELIQLLCKKKNAVFLSESSAFDCLMGNEMGILNDTLNMGIGKVWSETKEIYPLLLALQKKEIEYAGFDCLIYGIYAKHYLANYLQSVIDTKKILTKSELEFLKNLSHSITAEKFKYKFSDKDYNECNRLFSIIDENKNSFTKEEYYILMNFRNLFKVVKRYDNNESNFHIMNNYRDSLMAENCIYLIENFYKDRFIVMSAASFHLIKNHKKDYLSSDKNVKTMGDYLNEKYKEKYTVMIFTSAKGEHALYSDTKVEKVPKPKKESIEAYLFNTNVDYAFINLHNTPYSYKYCMPDGYEYVKMPTPLIHFDYIFYVKEMQRANSRLNSK
jgi:erythromycin esterase-like protein